MSERTNEIDLSAWTTVCTNGEWFCGRRSPTNRKLESLQKLVFQFGILETPKGPRPHVVVLTYPWLTDSIEIPEGALWVAVQAMPYSPDGEPVPWGQIIGTTEQLKLERNAKRAGLHLVGR
jgi:hypothetical protein